MGAIGDLVVTLRGDIKDFSEKLNTAKKQMTQFVNKTNGSLGESMTKTSESVSSWAGELNKNYGKATAALKSHNLGLKDTARIVQGILVSQAFYQVAGHIREANQALHQFNENLDYAQVTFGALFNSSDLATDYLDVLQEHSVNTIFDMDMLSQASKKMLAYGMEYKNLMFLMQGLTNLGAMSGDSDALDRVSYAIGQIYAKGTLKAEEMRQLANAYVPIQEIIQSRFNLTDDQLGRVGDLQLPAEDVINAIVDYANENFGKVGEAAMVTFTGIKNRIVDTLKVAGVDVLGPMYTVYKSFLKYIADGLDAFRDIYEQGGLGGVFEKLVPNKNTQAVIRQFTANVQNALMAFVSVGKVVLDVFKNIGAVFINAFNAVAPVLIFVTNVLANFFNEVLNTKVGMISLRTAVLLAAASFVVLKVQATSAMIITALSKAVVGLAKALLILSSVITKHPIIMFIAALSVGLIGLMGASEKARKALSTFFGSLNSLGGKTGKDMFAVTNAEAETTEDKLGKFNNRLEETEGLVDSLKDGIGKAGKAAKKSLLSFDEVFRLNDNNSGGTIGGGIDDLLTDLEGIGGDLGEFMIPEIPDFRDFIDSFTDSMFGGLKDSLLGKVTALGLGGWLLSKLWGGLDSIKTGPAVMKLSKAILKALTGAFMGVSFDTIVGPFTDKLWTKLEEAIKLKEGSAENASLGATIGSVLGGALGMAFGGLKGSVLGSAIGHFGGGLVGLFAESIGGAFGSTGTGLFAGMASAIAKAFTSNFSSVLGILDFSSIKGLFGSIAGVFKATGAKSLLKGGLIGAAIGFFVDALAATLWDKLAERFKLGESDVKHAKVGQTIASLIGTVIGGLLGGPAGAVIGSAIGTFAGGIVGLFWEKLGEGFQGGAIGLGAGAATGTVIGGPIGAAIGAVLGGLVGFISGKLKEVWDNIDGDWGTALDAFKLWGADIKDAFFDGLFGEKGMWTWTYSIFEAVGMFWENAKKAFAERDWGEFGRNILEGILAGLTGILTAVFEPIVRVFNAIIEAICAVFGIHSPAEALKPYGKNILLGILEGIVGAVASIPGYIASAGVALLDAISGWLHNIKVKISEWFGSTKEYVKTVWGGLWDTSRWITGWNQIKDWFSNLFSSLSNWFSDLGKSIGSWWDNLWSDKKVSVSASASTVGSAAGLSLSGHASGGIFNREHVARFAEGNKAEAIIPLENNRAMQPFVDAVSQGLTQSLAPMFASGMGNSQQLQPLYVGTLIADERSLKELERKMEVIRLQERKR